MLEFSLSLGYVGWAIVIVAALGLGILVQLVGEARFGYEWIVTAIAAVIGAITASEFIVDWRTFQPVYDDLALVPALIGGLVVGLIVAVVVRYLFGGSLLRTAEV